MRALPVLLLLVFVTAGPCAAGGETDSPRLDPVVASVVRMLDEKVSPESISQWLDQAGSSPGTLAADDLIALERAGAPEPLVEKILQLAAAAKQVEAPAPSPAEPTTLRELLPLAPLPSVPLTPRSNETVPALPDEPLPGVIPVLFDVRYAPQVIEYETTAWDLFVYVDGRPLARFDGWAAHSAKHMDRRSFTEWLKPGRHVVRVLQEQHNLKSKRKGTWSHKARVFGQPIVLDLDAAGDWEVQVQVEASATSFTAGEAEYAILHDGRTVGEGSGAGPGKRRWPALCEEVEAELTPGALQSKAGRSATRDCLRWASLWEDVESIPDRATVRTEMAAYDFKPDAVASR